MLRFGGFPLNTGNPWKSYDSQGWMVGRWLGQRIRVKKCFRRLFLTYQLRLRDALAGSQPSLILYTLSYVGDLIAGCVQ